ncbi:hypothetical protein Syun_006774 [Stephania yunnanensis]|uniref:Uncharacterized protein n=1 Tax=Stephania yunnanensis TaxID=152371 RepID=A0AAP0PXY8_9MAGN
MLTLEPFSKGLGRSAVQPAKGSRQSASLRLTGLLAVDSHTCRTPWSVFQDGPNGSPRPTPRARSAEARRMARASHHDRDNDVSTGITTTGLWPPPHDPRRSTPRVDWRAGSSPFRIRPRRIAGPHPLPSRQFQALFDSLFKVLFIFPSRYLFAIGLSPMFSLGRNLPPDWGCIPKQPDSMTAPRGATGPSTTGLSPSRRPFPGDLNRSVGEDASTDYNSNDVAVRFSSLGSSRFARRY